jgi:hypothetical protein
VEFEQEIHQGVETWVVPLPEHDTYRFTRLKRIGLSDGSRHTVVVVDLSKLLACADRDTRDYVLPPVQDWHPGKIHGLRVFLDPHETRIPEMPYVMFSTRNTRGLLGLVGLEKEGVVSFRNGQHRARYMAAAGALSLPVEVHETEAALLARYCGV